MDSHNNPQRVHLPNVRQAKDQLVRKPQRQIMREPEKRRMSSS